MNDLKKYGVNIPMPEKEGESVRLAEEPVPGYGKVRLHAQNISQAPEFVTHDPALLLEYYTGEGEQCPCIESGFTNFEEFALYVEALNYALHKLRRRNYAD